MHRWGFMRLALVCLILGVAAPALAAPFYATNAGDATVKFFNGTSVVPFANTGSVPLGLDRVASGNTYVAELGTGSVRTFDPAGNQVGGLIGVPGAIGLRIGPDNNLYVGSASDQGGNGDVKRFTPAGSPLAAVPGNGGTRGITFANGGHLFVTNILTSDVLEYDETLAFVRAYDTAPSPQGLTTGPDGAVYVGVADAAAGGVYRLSDFTASGAFLPFAVAPGIGDNRALGLGFAPDDGNLYVANYGGNTVDRFNGATGAYLDSITGFNQPAYLVFVPEPASTALLAAAIALLCRGGNPHRRRSRS
jgi:DNA-binding beta-propeller fold protein YncE